MREAVKCTLHVGNPHLQIPGRSRPLAELGASGLLGLILRILGFLNCRTNR